jgi:hypothetical protein
VELDDDPDLQRELAQILRRKRAQELATEMEHGDQPSLNLQLGAFVRQQESPPQLVEGVLPEASLFQVFGETGSYKSFVMLDLALSIANGLDWMGHAVRSPGPVALVLGEGGADAGARLGAWLAAHPGSSDYLLAYSVEQQLDLMLPSHVDAMIADLEEHRVRRHPDQPWRMIVFDTQADHMPSGDEDRAKDFTVVKRSIQRISQATGAAVGLVHHTGWDKSRERGSSRQRQALDVVMQVDNKTITNIKQKSGRLFDPIKFETVERDSSLVVRPRTTGEGLAEAAASMTADLSEAQAVVLGVLQDPTLTARRIMATFNMGHPRLTVLLDLLDRLGYMTVVKGGRGRPDTFEVTDAGRQWAEG